jgi:hypothetical protein
MDSIEASSLQHNIPFLDLYLAFHGEHYFLIVPTNTNHNLSVPVVDIYPTVVLDTNHFLTINRSRPALVFYASFGAKAEGPSGRFFLFNSKNDKKIG